MLRAKWKKKIWCALLDAPHLRAAYGLLMPATPTFYGRATLRVDVYWSAAGFDRRRQLTLPSSTATALPCARSRRLKVQQALLGHGAAGSSAGGLSDGHIGRVCEPVREMSCGEAP